MIYALHDSNVDLRTKLGAFEITKSTANMYNNKGYGIFYTPNEFNGARRRCNCKKINYWIADIDEGTKDEMRANIRKIKHKPSKVVETKKGFHCYWLSKDATIDNYETIEKGIIHALKADKGCKDYTRLLRLPGYYHMKDVNDPFMIKVIEDNNEMYSETEMLYSFPLPKKKLSISLYKPTNRSDFLNPECWDRIFGLNKIGNGSRNNEFTRIVFWLRDEGFSSHEIRDTVFEMNRRIGDSLPDKELDFLIRSKV